MRKYEISRRKLIVSTITIALVVATASSVITYVVAQSGLGVSTLSKINFAGSPDFTVFTDGNGSYYAENVYREIEFSGTDSARVINDALGSGRHVFLSSGTYNIDSSIRLSQIDNCLSGDGWSTILTTSLNIDMVVMSGMFSEISNLAINGDKGSSNDGIYISGQRCRVDNVQIKNTYDGIDVSGTSSMYALSTSVSRCQIEQIAGNGINTANYASDSVVCENTIGNCSLDAIALSSGGSSAVITGNELWGSENGLVLYGARGCTVTGNRIDYNLYDGILVQYTTDNAVTGNNIYCNSMGVPDTYVGVELAGSRYITVSGNHFGLSSGETQKFAVLEDGSSNYNAVTRNTCEPNPNQSCDILIIGANSAYTGNVARVQHP